MIERLGIPGAFLVLFYILYVKTQAWNQKQQETTQQKYEDLVRQSQERYEDLTNRFIDTMNKIVVENTRCLTDLSQKVESHTKSKDEFIDIIKDRDAKLNDMYELLKDSIKNRRQ